MKYTLSIILTLILLNGYCQHGGQGGSRRDTASSVISTNTELMNFSGTKMILRYSSNMFNWKIDSVENKQQISLYIGRGASKCLVELCQGNINLHICDTFELNARERYAITLSDNRKKYVIRKAKDE